ncbi:ATP-dependent DNA helicase RecQ [Abditibacterium utsteinense]|uniref:ATP-dependent DNA helicase RecQ n=1 Tax=Abditibacterium utsteinense TaxID=1960156 RepID=A0A2S8SS64_9BACT|nr:ATP-dependent DNA helicase RecQ [Abditibacterium utsteinense]PQV63635.1 ATP-dependent DNA helicase RecQ [Abditibacterium utsteinense]
MVKPSRESVKFSFVPAVDHSLALHEKLSEIFGFGEFRHLQEEAIQAALDCRDCLVVMPTGAGKSLTFQLPAAMSEGVTIVISPLIALMRDQIIGLRERSKFAEIGAAYLNSSQSAGEQRDILTLLHAGRLKLLYVAPERLRSKAFVEVVRATKLARFVVDEAHCISEWGHDFRPDYLNIADFLAQIGHPPTFAVTATATIRVQDSIIHNLQMRDPKVVVGGFNRPNLHFSVVKCKNDAERGNKLFKALPKLIGRGGSGLIYVSTRKQCEAVGEIAAQALAPLGKKVGIYHAGMDNNLRSAMQEAWLRGDLPLLVATNAFGMGIDKSDVRFVIHWGFPESPESYYQEAGRAGRDGKRARVVILASMVADKRLREFFIENEAIAVADFQNVVKKLAKMGDGELRIPRYFWDQEFGWREPKPRVIIGKLERAGLIERRGEDQDGLSLRVLKREIAPAQMRVLAADLEREKASRFERLDEMLGYVRASGCRRRLLLDYFGDDSEIGSEFCCDNCDAGEGDSTKNQPEMPAGYVSAPSGIADIYDLIQGLDTMFPPVGKGRLVKILRGSGAADVTKFVKNPVYGVCSGVSVARIGEFIEDLIARGMLHQGDEEEYFVCRVTRAGRELWQLKSETDLEIPGRRGAKTSRGLGESSTASPQIYDASEGDEEIFEKLRAWRRALADEEHVPPYVIFSDKVLREIARQAPQTLNDLGDVSGVGPAKLDKYGAGVLELLNE